MATNKITDPDVRIFAALAADKESEYADDDVMWDGSPFRWIKTRPSRQIGSIAEALVSGWCATRLLMLSEALARMLTESSTVTELKSNFRLFGPTISSISFNRFGTRTMTSVFASGSLLLMRKLG